MIKKTMLALTICGLLSTPQSSYSFSKTKIALLCMGSAAAGSLLQQAFSKWVCNKKKTDDDAQEYSDIQELEKSELLITKSKEIHDKFLDKYQPYVSGSLDIYNIQESDKQNALFHFCSGISSYISYVKSLLRDISAQQKSIEARKTQLKENATYESNFWIEQYEKIQHDLSQQREILEELVEPLKTLNARIEMTHEYKTQAEEVRRQEEENRRRKAERERREAENRRKRNEQARKDAEWRSQPTVWGTQPTKVVCSVKKQNQTKQQPTLTTKKKKKKKQFNAGLQQFWSDPFNY